MYKRTHCPTFSYHTTVTNIINIKMTNIISLFVFAFLLAIGQCDLIGYNRLGNNVRSHVLYRDGNTMAMKNYRYQLFLRMMESNNLSNSQKQQWLPKSARTSSNKRQNNRLSHYKRSMGLRL